MPIIKLPTWVVRVFIMTLKNRNEKKWTEASGPACLLPAMALILHARHCSGLTTYKVVVKR